MKGPLPASRHAGLSLNAPAKINWFLGIAGKREDGYHNIVSLMQCISLHDTLTFAHADSVNIATDLDIPIRDNLVHKAASRLKDYASYGKGADILLKKNVPVSAGLGGGSSDAASTLLGLNELWGLELSRKRLSSIAAEIGSDVPFFLNGPVALVEGKGEKTIQVKIGSSVILLLVKPAISVSTAWAYADFDRMNSGKLTKKVVDIKLFCRALMRKDFASLGNMLFNDLDEVVTGKYPVVTEIKHRLIDEGAFLSAMSGSGPSVFGVFGSRESAEKAATRLEPHLCRVVETLI
jgi:4-diphosphocytidyl-2-C-methyl-D-erythritol kinase